MKAEELAAKFVSNYPLMFNEDKDFWIVKITQLLIYYEEQTRINKED